MLAYQTPPPAITALVDAPTTPAVSLDPTARWLALFDAPPLPPIAELAQPELRLAGLRLNPRTNGPSRESAYRGIAFQRLTDGQRVEVTGLPAQPRIRWSQWSPDGQWLAFGLTRAQGVELWVAPLADGRARQLTPPVLNAVVGTPFAWLSDSRRLVVRAAPAERGPAPTPPETPDGPVVQECDGKPAPVRTYQDLLGSPHDEALFRHYLTSRVALVDLDAKSETLGTSALYTRVTPSPDARHLLVSAVHPPFSYRVPYDRFPQTTQVWDLTGRVEATVAELPLAEDIPLAFDAVRAGRRAIGWRPDQSATLLFAEAQDQGDPRVTATVRDRVYLWEAPFGGPPRTLCDLGLRFGGAAWTADGLALVTESWWKTRRTKTWVLAPGAAPRLLWDRSFEDRYGDPGTPLLRPAPTGTSLLARSADGAGLFLSGPGATPEGNQPFIDRLDLATLRTTRLWRSAPPVYERVAAVVAPDGPLLLTSRETVDQPPNYHLRHLGDGSLRALTSFPHPCPALLGAHKELVRYQRADGLDLNATLYLPPGWRREQGPLPLLMWAYPREFKSADAAGQVTDSPHRFVRVHSHSPLYFLAHGYAVLDGPTMPIVGEGQREPNDTYLEQLVASAQAAVDYCVGRGVARRDAVAIGGHSYGAFMAANLLAHSRLFRAGIARSGAFNRTLTPFGFQAEERTLWEARDTYIRMSPFLAADRIAAPLLLIHGEADNNPGTHTMQSERLFNALQALGKPSRLVLLPHESHGYQARESVLHMLSEMARWLDRWVK